MTDTGSSGTRRLATILFADVVGYSRLIGLDDTGTLERLKALRSTLIDPAIDEHGGRCRALAINEVSMLRQSRQAAKIHEPVSEP